MYFAAPVTNDRGIRSGVSGVFSMTRRTFRAGRKTLTSHARGKMTRIQDSQKGQSASVAPPTKLDVLAPWTLACRSVRRVGSRRPMAGHTQAPANPSSKSSAYERIARRTRMSAIAAITEKRNDAGRGRAA